MTEKKEGSSSNKGSPKKKGKVAPESPDRLEKRIRTAEGWWRSQEQKLGKKTQR